MKLSQFNKAIVSLAAPLGVLLFCLSPTDGELAFVITRNEWYLILVALASTAGVYVVPNKK